MLTIICLGDQPNSINGGPRIEKCDSERDLAKTGVVCVNKHRTHALHIFEMLLPSCTMLPKFYSKSPAFIHLRFPPFFIHLLGSRMDHA